MYETGIHNFLDSKNSLLNNDEFAVIEQYLNTCSEIDLTEFHKILAQLNQKKFSFDTQLSPMEELQIDTMRSHMQVKWLEYQRKKVSAILETLPNAENFIEWLEKLLVSGYGQNHPLFDFLEQDASKQDYEFFMRQELATEAGFDDLVAMTQVQAPFDIKLELARNYWDELGNGTYEKIHSVQLSWVADALKVDSETNSNFAGIFWQPLAVSNLMLAFASQRCFFYQSIGALGAIELTAPSRCAKITTGMKRLGYTNVEYRYYALHVVLDVKHWQGWRDNVIAPLIKANPTCCKAIAEGFLLRLLAGKQCFDQYYDSLCDSSLKKSRNHLLEADWGLAS